MNPNQPKPPIFSRLMRLITVDRKVILVNPMDIIRVQEFRVSKNHSAPEAKTFVLYKVGDNGINQLLCKTDYNTIRQDLALRQQIMEVVLAFQGEGAEAQQFIEGDRTFFTSVGQDQIVSMEETKWSFNEDPNIQVDPVDVTVVRAGGLGLFFTLDTMDDLESRFNEQAFVEFEEEEEEVIVKKPTRKTTRKRK